MVGVFCTRLCQEKKVASEEVSEHVKRLGRCPRKAVRVQRLDRRRLEQFAGRRVHGSGQLAYSHDHVNSYGIHLSFHDHVRPLCSWLASMTLPLSRVSKIILIVSHTRRKNILSGHSPSSQPLPTPTRLATRPSTRHPLFHLCCSLLARHILTLVPTAHPTRPTLQRQIRPARVLSSFPTSQKSQHRKSNVYRAHRNQKRWNTSHVYQADRAQGKKEDG